MKNNKGSHARAEALFKTKERQADHGPKALAEHEAVTLRDKTARLRSLRLAKQLPEKKGP